VRQPRTSAPSSRPSSGRWKRASARRPRSSRARRR